MSPGTSESLALPLDTVVPDVERSFLLYIGWKSEHCVQECTAALKDDLRCAHFHQVLPLSIRVQWKTTIAEMPQSILLGAGISCTY